MESDTDAPLVFRLHQSAPSLVRMVLLERGWVEFNKQEQREDDWNLYWRASAFHRDDFKNIQPWQRLNHHPKMLGVTRKDCLARNLKRMRCAYGSALYDFSPCAFILPNNYTRFVADYAKIRLKNGGTPTYWICKPVDLSRGRGIFVFQDIKDLIYDSPVIVQKYISNPLLISGYKFDLRIYVCVKSFHPLTIYIHQEGLVRFATEKYNLASLDNIYAHLTNTSINKFSSFYSTNKQQVGQGCKWTLNKFRSFLRSQDINEFLLWQRINNIVTLTLLTVTPSTPLNTNCVELLGFDILIDANLKPWLLEVNSSPAMTLDCAADMAVKKAVLHDLVDLMNYQLADGLRQKVSLNPSRKRSHNCQRLPVHFNGSSVMKDAKPLTEPHDEGPHNQLLVDEVSDCDSRIRLPYIDAEKSNVLWNSGSDTSISATNLTLSSHLLHNGNQRAVASHTKTPSLPNVPHRDSYEELLKAKPTHRQLCRLPALLKEKYQPSERHNGTSRPPFRVGDFILTFPFNKTTFKASRYKPNIKTIVQEIQRLLNRLISPSNFKKRQTIVGKDAEDFASLFWGPRNPPLLRECCS